MLIDLAPQSGLGAETKLAVRGDILEVDGRAYDLSAVPESGQGVPEGEHPFVGHIRRIGGVIHCTVRVTLGVDAADHQPVDPAHWRVEVEAGKVAIPVARRIEGGSG